MSTNNATASQMDEDVRLDYPTSRMIERKPLVLGKHARIRSGSVLYEASIIGEYLETGHNVIIREQNRIGDHLSIWNNSCIDYGCEIGNNVRIHNNVYVAQFTIIEDDVFVAPGVMMANDPHPIGVNCMKGPLLRRGCRIGVNVTLLDHIEIGQGALIGAGSVVTNNIPAGMLAYGSPARVIKPVDAIDCKWCDERPYVKGLDIKARA